ncbi:MAG: hypothetical protein GXO48_02570 [Chlorobi bacterium]|nr:hypothetical protein [Chlorobiota bacterium]
MNRLLSILLLLVNTSVIYGQKTGIGTTNPIARFHIHTSVANTDSVFLITKGTSVIMVVTSSGKTGLNVASPTATLDVSGQVRFTAYSTPPLTGHSLLIALPTGTVDKLQSPGTGTQVLRGNLTWGPPPTGGTGLWVDYGSFISPSTLAPGKKFSVTDSGWIGIGTDNPGSHIHVVGPIWQTGFNNSTLIGVDAGASLVNAGKHVFVGDSAGFSSAENFYNVAVGTYSLFYDTTQSYNTAVGFAAMLNLHSGERNVAVGARSLIASQSNRSVGIGTNTIASCVSCADNIAIGMNALNQLEYGSNNVAMGLNALRDLDFGWGSVAIGSNALSATKYALFTSDKSVAIGDSALASTVYTGRNTAVGFRTIARDTLSSDVTAVGFEVMKLGKSNLDRNTAIGAQAMRLAGSKDNTAVGYAALKSNESGSRNVAIGSGAMQHGTSGSENVAVGSKALANNKRNYNVAVGAFALAADSQATVSIAIGDSAMASSQSSGINIAIGNRTLLSAKSGFTKNIVIGHDVGTDTTTTTPWEINNNLVITNRSGFKKRWPGTPHFTENTVLASDQILWDSLYFDTITASVAIGRADPGTGHITIGNVYHFAIGEENPIFISNKFKSFSSKGGVNIVLSTKDTLFVEDTSSVMIGIDFVRQDSPQLLKVFNSTLIGSGLVDSAENRLRDITSIGFDVIYPSRSYFFNATFIGHDVRIPEDYINEPGPSAVGGIGHGLYYNSYNSDSSLKADYRYQIGHGAGKNTSGKHIYSVGNNSLFSDSIPVSFENSVAIGNKSLSFLYLKYGFSKVEDMFVIGHNSFLIKDSSVTTPPKEIKACFVAGNNTFKVTNFRSLSGWFATTNVFVGHNVLTDVFGAYRIERNIIIGHNSLKAIGKNDTVSWVIVKDNVIIGNDILSRNNRYENEFAHNVIVGHGALNRNVHKLKQNVYIGEQVRTGNGDIVLDSLNVAVGAFSGPTNVTTAILTGALGYRANPTASYRFHFGNTSVNWIGGNVNLTVVSDSSYKHEIREDVSGLDFILKLRPVTYNLDIDKQQLIMYGTVDTNTWQEKYDIEKIRFSGFIAQEVDSILKSIGAHFGGLYTPYEVGGDSLTYSLSYEMFVVPLVKAIQEQQKILKDQEQQLANQERELQILKERIGKRQEILEKLQNREIVQQ